MSPTQEAVYQRRASVQGALRRPASAIDFDFHRAQAVALRRRAKRDAAALTAAGAVVVAVIGVATFAILVASAVAPAS